jgi:hypothetical protein
MVKIGSHMVRYVTANEWMELGETRWHALYARALEMLDAAKADPAIRVEFLKDIFAKRDETLQNAVQWAATIEGAVEIITYIGSKQSLDLSESLNAMTPEQIMTAALQLLGVEIASGN